MHLSVKSDSLKESLNKIITIVSKKMPRPILSNAHVSFTQTEQAVVMNFMVTDLEIFSKVSLPVEKAEDLEEFCVNAKNLFDLVKEVPNETLSLTLNKTQNQLEVACGKIRFALVVTGTEEFPQRRFKENASFFIPSSKLSALVSKTSYAISTDETMPFINGIFFQQIEGKLRGVATDGHRLALYDLIGHEIYNEHLIEGILIPKKGVIEIKKMADAFPNDELKISLDDSFLYLDARGDYHLSINLIVREFPRYQSVIPSKTVYQVKVEKALILNALKRVKIFASERFNGIKFSLSDSLLTISGQHPSMGEARESLEVDYHFPEMEMAFNANFLFDALLSLDVKYVHLLFNNELSPILLRSEELPEFLSVIMPLKL